MRFPKLKDPEFQVMLEKMQKHHTTRLDKRFHNLSKTHHYNAKYFIKQSLAIEKELYQYIMDFKNKQVKCTKNAFHENVNIMHSTYRAFLSAAIIFSISFYESAIVASIQNIDSIFFNINISSQEANEKINKLRPKIKEFKRLYNILKN